MKDVLSDMMGEICGVVHEPQREEMGLAPLGGLIGCDCSWVEELVEHPPMSPPPRSVAKQGKDPTQSASGLEEGVEDDTAGSELSYAPQPCRACTHRSAMANVSRSE